MKKSSLPKIITILGPTASGKTALSIELCKKFHGAVVSADSRQVYRGLDIGTSKVTEEEKQGIAHCLIDVVDVKEEFSVAQYQRLAFNAIEEVYKNGKTPFLVGGTGLYIDAVIKNPRIPTVAPDKNFRESCQKKLTTLGIQALERELLEKNPGAGKYIDLKNPRRIIRALEILSFGKISLQEAYGKKNPPRYDALKIGISWPREKLYERSDQRIDAMIRGGLLREVQSLRERGVTHERLESLGLEYRYASWYLRKEFLSVSSMVQELKYKQHAYIRRQMTWFRKDLDIQWVEGADAIENVIEYIEAFLGHGKTRIPLRREHGRTQIFLPSFPRKRESRWTIKR